MILIRATEAGWGDYGTHDLLCGTEQKWGFTLGNSISQIMPKMPLSMKPAESISKHAIRNASTAKKGLIKWGLAYVYSWSSKTPVICVKEKYFQLVISAWQCHGLELFTPVIPHKYADFIYRFL